jgi:hypothetical protein
MCQIFVGLRESTRQGKANACRARRAESQKTIGGQRDGFHDSSEIDSRREPKLGLASMLESSEPWDEP